LLTDGSVVVGRTLLSPEGAGVALKGFRRVGRLMETVQIFSPFFAYSKVKIGGYKSFTPKKRLQKSRKTHNTCGSWLACDGLQCAAFILVTRVIVNDYRGQASSYKGPG
jgi:hypothetical protein